MNILYFGIKCTHNILSFSANEFILVINWSFCCCKLSIFELIRQKSSKLQLRSLSCPLLVLFTRDLETESISKMLASFRALSLTFFLCWLILYLASLEYGYIYISYSYTLLGSYGVSWFYLAYYIFLLRLSPLANYCYCFTCQIIWLVSICTSFNMFTLYD